MSIGRHGLWALHREFRKYPHLNWWDDKHINQLHRLVEAMNWNTRGRPQPVHVLVSTCALRFMRRYGLPKTIGEYNKVVERIGARMHARHNTIEAARMRGLAQRRFEITVDSNGDIASRLRNIDYLGIKIIEAAGKCLYCGNSLWDESHAHCGSKVCREIHAFQTGMHGAMARPIMRRWKYVSRELNGLAIVAEFLKRKGNLNGSRTEKR